MAPAAALAEAVRALPVRDTPAIRRVRAVYSRQLRAAPPGEVIAVALELAKYGLRWVGYELILHHPGALAALDLARIERLGEGLDDWSGVDAFGVLVVGPAWLAGRISLDDVRQWAMSPDLWVRRRALVATTVLNSRTRGRGRSGGEPAATLSVCTLLIEDRTDMVVKAMSWALRSLAEVDPVSARGFLSEHRVRLAPRVLRELDHKLATGLKSPRRR